MDKVYWELVMFDRGKIFTVTSHEYEAIEVPDFPILLIIQLNAPTPEILQNGAQWYYSKSDQCWMEMEGDYLSLTERLRVEVHDWDCWRPGWWLRDRARWKQVQYDAKDRLNELKYV